VASLRIQRNTLPMGVVEERRERVRGRPSGLIDNRS
jgi:hypothetical protein